MLVLTQNILIDNILETVGISDCNTQGSPKKLLYSEPMSMDPITKNSETMHLL